ncbi:MAG TPA: aminotransferase class I/II-fold pyridoxal phosphate-dependent enzyme [Candidatus Hydrogenedentes bacterium]|nr:aminotransferase class I/II-fold pyridoxal phosphate-dependent enzyme [Candidatus Hydrogenedentota bacterium]
MFKHAKNDKLAIKGGPKAKTTPNIAMYPGGQEIGEEEKREVLEVLDHKYLFRYYGPEDHPSKVAELEKRFAAKFGAEHALAMNSCTSTLISALVAGGVGPGDEVIVNGYTFFASAASIVAAKAIPMICDIDDTFTLDLDDLERRLTDSTKAVIAVHMRGAPCDMERLVNICKSNRLFLIEDVAQACGGSYKGKKLGTFGDIGCFSFQYHKMITAGEGGMCITNDARLYDRLMGYHDTAACWRPDRFAPERYQGELFCGVNFRMGELAGAVMLAQLDKLDGLLEKMRENKRRIKNQINDIERIAMRRLHDEEGDTGICLMFMLEERGKVAPFVEALQAEGIDAAGVFNKGIPDWHIYAHWKHLLGKQTSTREGCPWTCPYHKGRDVSYSEDMCPNTLNLLGRAVHIDIPPQMTEQDCDMIAAGIRKVAKALL